MHIISIKFFLILLVLCNICFVCSNEHGNNCINENIGDNMKDPSCSTCIDLHENCKSWALSGKCTSKEITDLEYDVQKNCKLSCGSCVPFVPDIAIMETITAYGTAQQTTEHGPEVMKVIESSIDYMKKVIEEHPDDNKCLNTHKKCALYAALDMCDKEQEMLCGPSCKTCHLVNIIQDENINYVVDEEELRDLLEDIKKDVAVENEDETKEDVDNKGDLDDILLQKEIKKYGVAQSVEEDQYDSTMAVIIKSLLYLKTIDMDEESSKECTNDHELCSFWAGTNECKSNRDYMSELCALSCLNCLGENEDDGDDEE